LAAVVVVAASLSVAACAGDGSTQVDAGDLAGVDVDVHQAVG
jgi:hypothetical protein